VYRFLLSPRWIGLGLLMTLAAATMVGLGLWQLDRYHLRAGINERIDDAAARPPAPLAQVLVAPRPAVGSVGAGPGLDASWSRVTVTGRYDRANEILAHSRTLNGQVGFEVVTPLRLADGSAVLVDRGWLPPAQTAAAPPEVPPAPTGDVTVVGRVHAPESRAGPAQRLDGWLSVRRISPASLVADLPYPLYGAYVTMESQSPPADPTFVAIPPEHQNAAMNAGYVVQWWLFAALTLVGLGFLVVREARTRAASTPAEDHERSGVRVTARRGQP
jgi:cytochrome oxidase assembly protein ShyY1